jgi:PAS domain S-box-containing protein
MSARALSSSVYALAPVPAADDPVIASGRAKTSSQIRTATRRRQLVIEVLIALAIPLVALSTLQLLRLGALVTGMSVADGEWSKYTIPVAVLVIFAAVAVAFVALVTQNRWRRELEGALSQSESFISLCAEAADVAVWQWDLAGTDFSASDHCRELLRMPPDQAFTLSGILDEVHADDRSLVRESVQRGLQSNSSFEVEFRLRPTSDRVRSVRMKARPVRRADGNVAHLLGTIVDITDIREMKLEIERQRQSLAHLTRVSMVGKLSNTLAHELNQPLTAIMSNAQAVQRLITKIPLDIDELKSAIEDIIQDDTRAGEVIRHIRGLLKNKADFFEELDLNAVVASALEFTHGDLVVRHISVTADFWERPLPIKGDSVQLQQVILNLILNAGEAIVETGQPAGSMTVRTCTLSDGSAYVGISDTGPGIRSENFVRLFDPFFTTKEGGMGLGLSISRGIILRHGGQIWATNNRQSGTTFHVSLPLAPPDTR